MLGSSFNARLRALAMEQDLHSTLVQQKKELMAVASPQIVIVTPVRFCEWGGHFIWMVKHFQVIIQVVLPLPLINNS